MTARLARLARLARIEVQWGAARAGYWFRPYDSHLDARRWRWERSGCERSHAWWQVHRAQLEPVVTALARDGWHDPTHGQIDRDIQEYVDRMEPSSLGQRAAIENTLQTRRDRGELSW